MVRQLMLAGLTVGMLAGTIGCCGRSCFRRPLFGGRAESPPRTYLEGPAPLRSSDLIPAERLPTPPPPVLQDVPTTPPPPVESRSFQPDPPKAGKELLLPDPLPRDSSSKKLPANDLLLEVPGELQPRSDTPPGPAAVPAQTAANRSTPAEARPIPGGVPGFARVKDGVANGRKPNVDGFDALRLAGVRTAVYLHKPGADVAPTRELAERKGLIFLSLPVAATTLNADFGRFAEIVGDPASRSLYVFDEDGQRTGTLWYLYFRTVDSLSDDAAQVRTAPLGLRDAGGDEKTAFWLAIQEYLSKR